MVVAALPVEVAPLARALSAGPVRAGAEAVAAGRRGPWRIALGCCGVGPDRAREFMRAALRTDRPAQVLSIGYCGALSPAVAAGEVVACSSALLRSEGRLVEAAAPPGPLAGALAGLRAARWVTIDRLAGSIAEKRALAAESGAEVVDMETAAILQVCAEHGVPCAGVRVVLDGCDDEVVVDLFRLADDLGRVRWGRVAALLLRRPWRIAELIRFGRRSRRCAQRLRKAVLGLLGEAKNL